MKEYFRAALIVVVALVVYDWVVKKYVMKLPTVL